MCSEKHTLLTVSSQGIYTLYRTGISTLDPLPTPAVLVRAACGSNIHYTATPVTLCEGWQSGSNIHTLY